MRSLTDNNTWEFVDSPQSISAKDEIPSKWVLKFKWNSKGEIVRCKARLLLLGCKQKYKLAYLETSAHVLNKSSLRILFSIATSRNAQLHHMDVDTACLNSQLDMDNNYMRQPSGFVLEEGKVCHLRKSLYRLQQAPRLWNIDINKTNFDKNKSYGDEVDGLLCVNRWRNWAKATGDRRKRESDYNINILTPIL